MSSDGRTLLDRLVEAVVTASAVGLSPEVLQEGRRALMNVVGVAVAGSRHTGVDGILGRAGPYGPGVSVGIPGRSERVDPYTAALAIGFAAHVDDFDDTHLDTVIHPSAACLAALMSAAAMKTGPAGPARDTLLEFCMGIEVQLRFGLALGPEHYEAGWHTTGTCGVMGAAVTAGLVLGLSADQLRGALGLAASCTLGQREVFGSDGKAIHAGKAAANGLLCAVMAAEGMRSSRDILDGPRGYFSVLGPGGNPERLVEDFGRTWALRDLTYKPYPCGIVAHPAIDAAIRFHGSPPSDEVVGVAIRCNPLVVDLMGINHPRQGLEARFSTVHAVACGLVDGAFGLDHVTDTACARPDLADMRARIELQPDPTVPRQAATLVVRLRDGGEVIVATDAARGSVERPLTAEELHIKARSLLTGRLGDRTAEEVVSSLAESPPSGSLTNLLVRTTVGAEQLAGDSHAVDGPGSASGGPTRRPTVAVDVTGALAEFILEAGHSDTSAVAARMSERTLANAVAAALLGAGEDPVRQAHAAFSRLWGGQGPVTGCFGRRAGLPPVYAAIANGMAIHVLDFDDTYLDGDIHLGAPVLPAALAAAELVGADGSDLLAALTVGMETAARVALATHEQQFAQGWHLTSTAGRIGAAAAASRLLGLTGRECINALGLAATQAGGPRSAFGSPAKAWHARKAAADGLEGALLAGAGLTGPDFPLEGRRGYAAILAPGSDISGVLEGLSVSWLCERNSFKPYSCGVVAHPSIDAAIELRRRGVLPPEIERVTVGVHPAVVELMGNLRPNNGLEAKFSVAHCVAVGLCDGAAGPDQFSDDRVADPEVERIRERVQLCPDPTVSRDAAWITLSRTDHRVLEARIPHASGSAANPMTEDQLREKAHRCHPGDPVMVDELMDRLFDLPKLPSVTEFWSLVHGLGSRPEPGTNPSDDRAVEPTKDMELSE